MITVTLPEWLSWLIAFGFALHAIAGAMKIYIVYLERKILKTGDSK